jgi:hypothetical protein
MNLLYYVFAVFKDVLTMLGDVFEGIRINMSPGDTLGGITTTVFVFFFLAISILTSTVELYNRE